MCGPEGTASGECPDVDSCEHRMRTLLLHKSGECITAVFVSYCIHYLFFLISLLKTLKNHYVLKMDLPPSSGKKRRDACSV
jgi:hypothetical protein